jgi:4-amino-4-deoxy-L-arabinose transferase-like glycosyltransferase
MGAGSRFASLWSRPSAVLALACFALHALANGRYGFFRDELYFIVCGDRPDWGYVDQPALVPILASRAHALFGDVLWGFRLLPALVMTATVAGSAEFTRLVGGGRFAQGLAGLCVLLAPILLLMGVIFYTDMFQALTWLGLAWALVRLEQTRDQRWWLVFGAIAGFSLNTKYLIAFFAAGLALGLLAAPRLLLGALRRPWLYLGALLAGAMILPNLLWQQAHGWPFLELGKAGMDGKNLALSPSGFLLQQAIYSGPWAVPVWACGLWACLVRPKLAVARAFAIAWLALMVMFQVLHGKPYYPSAIYPVLLAFGAQRIEAWMAAPQGRGAALRGACLGAVVLLGLLAAPFTLPILPVEAFVRYQKAIGFMPNTGEHTRVAVLPQYYADMFGWPEMAARVAAVYRSLPPQDRTRAVFYGDNYGEAAAIDVFGPRLGLPPAISGHNQYFLWGPRGHDGSVMIITGGRPQHYADLFGRFDVVGRIDHPYARPLETGRPIYVLRGMKQPLGAAWPTVKHYE